jgi:hypothetical protein
MGKLLEFCLTVFEVIADFEGYVFLLNDAHASIINILNMLKHSNKH